MTALAIAASATCAAVVAGLMWVIYRLGRAHGTSEQLLRERETDALDRRP